MDEAGRRLQAAITAARGRRSVSDVAREAGVLRQTLYKWFGGGTPSLPELQAVARVLDVSLASLVSAWDGPRAARGREGTDDLSPAARAAVARLEAEIEGLREAVLDLAAALRPVRPPDESRR